jgi:hypothetical protein
MIISENKKICACLFLERWATHTRIPLRSYMMRQVTLISLYGQKTNDLERMINDCIRFTQNSLIKQIFIPYTTNQVHGTLIGMEKLFGFTENFNLNIWIETGKREVMEFTSLKKIIKNHLPMKIRFGGFQKSYNQFYSLGKKPYERSFQIQWKANKITLIGWPHKNGDFISTRALESLREDISINCNIQYKYKFDNDFYMVLGEIKGHESLTAPELKEMVFSSFNLEEKIRNYVANNFTEVEITPDQVFLSQYLDETLPLESTIPYCIANPDIDAYFISKLYS